ncbi:MAG: glycosyltransferase WbuB [Robiginitomaculum sp.]|nr:MAG: glycosyltransferase WbuB [Robiginitomaculum sp.]
MHILFLSDNFPPEINAPASRTFEHCREWVKAGHQVTVITCAPNFPKGKVFDGYRNRLWQSEEMAGIRVIRVWSYITKNEGFIKRILDYLSFMVSAIIAALFVRKADIVVGTSPQFFTACAAYVVGAYKRIPFVFELRDLWPESIKAVGAMRPGRLLSMLEAIEHFLYRRAALIISVTHSFKQVLEARGIDGDNIHVVTNGIDLQRFQPLQKDENLVSELGLEGKFIAGYIGTHGLAHALETLLEVARQIRDHPKGERFCLLMLGDGAKKVELVAKAQGMKLDNIIFLDTVPKADVPRYWSLLDVAIIHLRDTPLFQSVIPSKLFESMGMGIPIVHGVRGESAKIVHDHKVGLTFEPENAEQLCAQLLRLQTDHALYEDLRTHCLRAAPKFDRRVLAGRLLSYLEATVERRKGQA